MCHIKTGYKLILQAGYLDQLTDYAKQKTYISYYDDNYLIYFFNATKQFYCVFQILWIVEEIQYIKMIKKDNLLSADALEFHDSSKKVLLSYSLLACTIQWYNDLTQNLIDLEKMLIKDDWEKVCDDLKKGTEEKWTKNGNYCLNIICIYFVF